MTLRALDTTGLDRLADAAARTANRTGEDDETILREAMIVGRARARAREARRRAIGIGAVLLAAAAVLAFVLVPRERSIARQARPIPMRPAAAPAPFRFSLPSGDRLAGTAASRFEIVSADSAREIHLRAGEMLFDVAPLAEDESFAVRTPHAVARVHGTVFVVRVDAHGTNVDVFDGIVSVEDARGEHRLEAGESYATAPRTDRTSPLASLAREAAASRRAAPRIARSESRSRVPTPTPTLEEVRRMVARAEYEQALAAIDRARPRTDRGEWAMLEADAARGLGRLDRAAEAYERAARTLSPSRAAVAGLLAAQLFERRGDPARALRALDAARSAERGSPVEERALALRARMLDRLGRSDEARSVARDYLAFFPNGSARTAMDALLALQ